MSPLFSPAVIIPNGNGCTYYSYAADGAVATMNYNNITDALAAAKAAGYTREQHWNNITAAEATAARDVAASFNGTTYNLSLHNCWNMVFEAIDAANTNIQNFGGGPNVNFNKNKDLDNGDSQL